MSLSPRAVLIIAGLVLLVIIYAVGVIKQVFFSGILGLTTLLLLGRFFYLFFKTSVDIVREAVVTGGLVFLILFIRRWGKRDG